MSDINDRKGHRDRSEDHFARQLLKWVAGIVSALIVAGVTWNFHTVIELQDRIELIEYALQYHGIGLEKK